MMHLLRPWWLLLFVPWVGLLFYLWRKSTDVLMWRDVCDPHLIPFVVEKRRVGRQTNAFLCLFGSTGLMILALCGPTWSRLAVPTFHTLLPRVIVLDMSQTMAATDLSPNRLTRAKFKLHDLFQSGVVGQWGLIAYTSQPFVVSPLTDDPQTIEALLPNLTLDIMPVGGSDLQQALLEAKKLFDEAGFGSGEILVVGAAEPDTQALRVAHTLFKKGINVSVLPTLTHVSSSNRFKDLAKKGHGFYLSFTDDGQDWSAWIQKTQHRLQLHHQKQAELIPVWRDDGRVFLVLAAVLWLFVFRRGFWLGMGV